MLLNYITDSKLMTEWNDKKNQNLNPKEITLGSHKKVWWKCEKGHEWEVKLCY